MAQEEKFNASKALFEHKSKQMEANLEKLTKRVAELSQSTNQCSSPNSKKKSRPNQSSPGSPSSALTVHGTNQNVMNHLQHQTGVMMPNGMMSSHTGAGMMMPFCGGGMMSPSGMMTPHGFGLIIPQTQGMTPSSNSMMMTGPNFGGMMMPSNGMMSPNGFGLIIPQTQGMMTNGMMMPSGMMMMGNGHQYFNR